MISPEEHLAPLVEKWIDKGFQVCSHAIGDRANTVVLDAYEKALPPGVTARELRLRIEHAQILVRCSSASVARAGLIVLFVQTMDDIARTGQLGVISSVQPTHATSDMGYAEARIGPERIKGAYAWTSLAK